MTREIKLTQGQVALVDDEDYEWLNQWKWCAAKTRYTFYARRNVVTPQRRIKTSMHRIILDAPDGVEVDHIDGNGLNNTRGNLRIATRAQNLANRRKHRNNTSGYKGINRHGNNLTWQAQIRVNGRKVNLGTFENPEDAARAYDKAARELHGEFAKTNFLSDYKPSKLGKRL